MNRLITLVDPDGGGGRGSGPPENNKNIGFLSNTSVDPLKMTKLPSQHSMSGDYRHASETDKNRCFSLVCNY